MRRPERCPTTAPGGVGRYAGGRDGWVVFKQLGHEVEVEVVGTEAPAVAKLYGRGDNTSCDALYNIGWLNWVPRGSVWNAVWDANDPVEYDLDAFGAAGSSTWRIPHTTLDRVLAGAQSIAFWDASAFVCGDLH